MAEAIVAFGIAANIVQFIDFGSKVLSTGYRISLYGELKENHELESITSTYARSPRGLKIPFRRIRNKS